MLAIQNGYNEVICVDNGINISLPNFLPTGQGCPSVLKILRIDSNEEITKSLSKIWLFNSDYDATSHVLINNDGIYWTIMMGFIKQINRDNPLQIEDNFINLQEWMNKVQEILSSVGGINGSGYSFSDLITDVVGLGSFLAQVGVFAAIYAAIKLAF